MPMFDLAFNAQITTIAIKVKEKDAFVRRLCKLTLAREFDDELAQAIGSDATKALKALRSHGISEVTIPIDRFVGSLKLKGITEDCAIPVVRGVKVKAKAGDVEDGGAPTVQLLFDFDFLEEAWVFMGRNCLAYAQVTLKQSQETLQFEAPAKSKSPSAH